MSSDNFAFEFVKIDMPPAKPREVGVIEMQRTLLRIGKLWIPEGSA